MKKVLLVEDDQMVASLLKQYIAEIDHSLEAVSFFRAAEAYRYAKDESVELFILDIQLLDYKGQPCKTTSSVTPIQIHSDYFCFCFSWRRTAHVP